MRARGCGSLAAARSSLASSSMTPASRLLRRAVNAACSAAAAASRPPPPVAALGSGAASASRVSAAASSSGSGSSRVAADGWQQRSYATSAGRRAGAVAAKPPQKQTVSAAGATLEAPPASAGDYNASQIQVLEGLDPVRKRPGMYIGTTTRRGLHHLLSEVVDNSIDEAQAGFATRVEVELQPGGWVSVTDDGRGIPTDLHPATGKSALETVLTVLHAGGKFGGDAYSVSGGLHGVGVSVVNALSDEMEVTVWRDGQAHEQRFARGVPQGSLRTRPQTAEERGRRGTRVRFLPDASIFTEGILMERDVLAVRLRELAFLNAGVTVSIAGSHAPGAAPEPAVFRYDGGIAEFVAHLTEAAPPLTEVVSIAKRVEGVEVAAAMRWSRDVFSESLAGYANSIRTVDGGTHLDGLKAALTKSVNALARKYKLLKEGDPALAGDHIREGLTAVVAVRVRQPEFEGQTKTRLGNAEVRRAVEAAVADEVTVALEMRPEALQAVVERALMAARAADAAKRARELERRQSVLVASSLPGKLADCSSANPADREIFVVEGDSAGGTAKQARDRRTQAVLPLRGKILNAERVDESTLYKNKEITNLIQALGLGAKGEDASLGNLRYHRVVILTDADVDGAHIRTLLLTFFYRYRRALFEKGHVYVGVPPLYKVSHGRGGAKERYCYDEDDLRAFLATLPAGSDHTLQRFKGLGEMMPAQLWETTLDPARRRLRRVTVHDGEAADRMFELLMSDDVGPRRDFIKSEGPRMGLELQI